MSQWLVFLVPFSILAYALVGGVFLAFSDFIMRALARTSGDGGHEAMQLINREVFHWIFMALFLGLAPLSLFFVFYGASSFGGPGAALLGLAGVVYLVGGFGVTICFNVPMNKTLDLMQTASAATKSYWSEIYLPRWTFWNSVRTVACGVSSILLMMAWQRMLQSP